jgi:hypothetical protein
VFPRESRPERRNGRERRRPDLAALECLEKRELLAFSVLGTSLPDLTVSGYASPVASWNGPLTVTVNVQNVAASSQVEPLALPIGSPSSADAGPFAVGVYISRSPTTFKKAVRIGEVDFAGLTQNTATQATQTVALPPQIPGFPNNGGKIYVLFKVNDTRTVLETNAAPNTSKVTRVTLEAPLPELSVVGFDVPPVMQPGDTIQPNIRIANLGPADTAPQGPVTIALVASTTPTFNSGSSIIATYSIDNIPGETSVSTATNFLGDANQTPQNNVVTINSQPVTLPVSPAVYFLGVVIDPEHQIDQLSVVGRNHANPFSLSHKVGPPINHLPPAGVTSLGGVADIPVFPTAFGGVLVGGTAAGAPLPAFPVSPAAVAGAGSAAGSTATGTPALNSPLFSTGSSRAAALTALAHSGVSVQTTPRQPVTTSSNNSVADPSLKSVRLVSKR